MNKGWEELGAGVWNPEPPMVIVAQGVAEIGWQRLTRESVRQIHFLLQESEGEGSIGVRKVLEDPPVTWLRARGQTFGIKLFKKKISLLYSHKFSSNPLSLKIADRKKLLQHILMRFFLKKVVADIARFLICGLRIKLRAVFFEVWPLFKTQR